MRDFEEGEYLVCQSYPSPKSLKMLSIQYRGSDYDNTFQEASSSADLENMGRDYSVCSVCKVINGEIYKLDIFQKVQGKLIEPDEDEELFDLTEEDELIAQYGRSNLEFVRDQEWVSDDLERYLGKL
ncbi:hypothetical protein [Iningainema tapete]|uniref:Uncharacterized protein n=1 Tax=Iningainema tapete BLCC-T55 TaxID=2748662 RepID=A0A8J6XIT5_9CYAN|nr:hypothetical protein [Iningainema tapete]MBD2773186.1 hypothetical protein [Iningainema tapete BLCC-T55]